MRGGAARSGFSGWCRRQLGARARETAKSGGSGAGVSDSAQSRGLGWLEVRGGRAAGLRRGREALPPRH